MYSCLIIDDDLIANAHLKLLVSKRDDLLLKRTFTKSNEALDYLNEERVDFVFLDIYMPGLNGLEMAKLIKNKTSIIFTTSSINHALEAWDLGATDYLLKPIKPERFKEAIDKIIMQLQYNEIENKKNAEENDSQILKIIADRKNYNINIEDIIYVESKAEYLCYFTNKGNVMSLGSLKELSQKLPPNKFIRISYSFIIKTDFVTSYNAISVTMKDNKVLKIGRVYKNDFKELMASQENLMH